MSSLKLRSVNTAFWSDPYVENLDPSEKLLFIYLITNSFCNLSGIYKVTLKRMAFETGIDRDMITKMMARLEDDGKAFYYEGYVILPNFQNHQRHTPVIQEKIKEYLEKVPESVLKFLYNATDKFPHTIETDTADFEIPEKNEKVDVNVSIDDRISQFIVRVRNFNKERMILDEDQENDFLNYWTEKNSTEKKFRKEDQKFFDLAKRMQTWKKNCETVFAKKKQVIVGTGRVVGSKDTDDFKKRVEENNKKIERSGLYNPANDPEFNKLMRRVV